MSRYRVEPCKVSKTRNIYGPGRQVLGYIYGPWKPESERLKRFIESYDEIIDALRSAANELNEWDAFHETKPLELKQIYALIERIESEEAQ